MIHIIDYGLGNTKAIASAYKHMYIDVCISKTKEDLVNAKKIILPGVGSFDSAVSLFKNSDMYSITSDLVLNQSIPILGICVGMQMLFNRSEEGLGNGLEWIDGEISNLREKVNMNISIPHMGWNNITPLSNSSLLSGLGFDSKFYFSHSYASINLKKDYVLANTNHGVTFDCVVQKNNIYGVQFHPEKSHHWGQLVLKNFSEI
jgi:glutamine amidotransferase